MKGDGFFFGAKRMWRPKFFMLWRLTSFGHVDLKHTKSTSYSLYLVSVSCYAGLCMYTRNRSVVALSADPFGGFDCLHDFIDERDMVYSMLE